ncbi:uncharacterized protein [Physcomitrium patens]|uniref:uncharacterized protein isoform X2 n=1 Tax=Physcomitrium patens TaxID=3218 RepID=UPI000D15AB07|nr:CCR4-NOT transcription complex subunit 3-like isoform X2 [Physcomitrium patens]|eukprot:XP_024382467.1 CCR4-NOT transcription complex subunit 3-like isoform X2 [Physcomitrella patens]
MGATRKLQGEIDKVLKKVQEGVDVFDSIWNKVYDTENVNQKEKFEADLKKEIKKLQRYRDQIKMWIQSNEIKDKKALVEARKQIEREMERFKVCEKETKTKAFSKEGLGQQPKTDPRDKAKGESRDWLNNMVSELESQIDSFEAEMEGLQVKKGKARPPRLTHLEESINRHKLHIIKLELVLRLLDNDELSADEVQEVRHLVEDYVERNQEDFEAFEDVDDIYQYLPLDKIEALENLEAIPNVAPSIVVKEKAAVAAASGVGVPPLGSVLKPTIILPVTQSAMSSSLGISPLVSPSSQPVGNDDTVTSSESSAESPGTRTRGTPTLAMSPTSSTPKSSSPAVVLSVSPVGSAGVPSPSTGAGSLSRQLGNLNITGTPTGISPVRPVPVKSLSTTPALQPAVLQGRVKEDETSALSGRRVGPGLGGNSTRGQSPPPVTASGSASPLVSQMDLSKRLGLTGGDDRHPTGGGLSQQFSGTLGSGNRVFGPGGLGDNGIGASDTGLPGTRLFPAGNMPAGGQWRPHSANSQETGPYHVRSEIMPDQKQKFLQRYQQTQQGHSAASLLTGGPQLSSSSLKQPPGLAAPQAQLHITQQQQQNIILYQQNSMLGASQNATTQRQSSLGLVTSPQSPSPSSTPVPTHLSQGLSISSPQQLTQVSLSSATSPSEHDTSGRRVESAQQQMPSQLLKSSEDSAADVSSLGSAFRSGMTLSDDDLKNSDTFDVSGPKEGDSWYDKSTLQVGTPGTLADYSQQSRDADLASGQQSHHPQSSMNPGVIGRRNVTDLGAIGDNLTPALGREHFVAQHEALEHAYRNLPLPKDSERPKSYTPRYPTITPASYPQMQAPVIDNPALWERLDKDVLFYAFYYQQGTYQQYLAARELKKQSWRYHKKYNTWFQRHEEPKITTDEYETGTYVYFDFHVVHNDYQQGCLLCRCQRIKTEFTFEYCYLEDELIV